MFALVEMSGVELIGLRLFDDTATARAAFDAACAENHASEADAADLAREVAGTLALAGDDAYSVQLIERPPYYVQVIGSQDSCFVGPFISNEAATAYAEHEKTTKPQFDFYPMSESDMRANIAEFGASPIVPPEVID